eukprot:jgi/Chrzof1/851/Cz01g31110.t1
MGNCFSSDVQTKHAAGSVSMGNGATADVEAAVSLLSGAAAYSSLVELRINCEALKDADLLSAPDPMAVLFSLEGGHKVQLAQTECIANTKNPRFVKPFTVTYNFEKVQTFRLEIRDVDNASSSKFDVLGEVEFALPAVLTAKGKCLTLELTRGATPSKVSITAEEVSCARDVIHMSCSARKLASVEVLSKSDPFFDISRLQEDGKTWVPVYKSEVVDNNLNPDWRPVTVRSTQLCNGDIHRPLQVRVLDHESNGRHRLLGQFTTSAQKLAEAAATHQPLQLYKSDGATAAGGSFIVNSYQVECQPSFWEYIRGGVEINFLVAIDFTASNEPYNNPQSLHYLHPSGTPTPYEHAIYGIGRVLEFYDSDKMFPVYGFGGQMPDRTTSHCFAINGNNAQPFCAGVHGIAATYREALLRYPLSGPTLFTPVIKAATAIASQPSALPKYYCLLILTDGQACDMEDTVSAVIAASRLPLSIMIVGVGSADFSAMRRLDSDGKLLRDRTGIAERDIVQFVEFNTLHNDGTRLAAELLGELPGQFLQYMRSHRVSVPALPSAPPQVSWQQ